MPSPRKPSNLHYPRKGTGPAGSAGTVRPDKPPKPRPAAPVKSRPAGSVPPAPPRKGGPDGRGPKGLGKPPLALQPTTLWEYPSQHYGNGQQGSSAYAGATPSWIIWNLLQRYTLPKDLVVDPMCGSGTTIDVARDLGRRALGYDIAPVRPDIFRVDARKLPLEDQKADFVFVDPPYSTHIDYSSDPECVGRLHAGDPAYLEALGQVIAEIDRILRPDRYMALYISDSFEKKKGFFPIGFEAFALLRKKFTPIDTIICVRHNRKLEMGNYRAAAEEGNFYLRGFNYLFIMYKKPESTAGKAAKKRPVGPQKF